MSFQTDRADSLHCTETSEALGVTLAGGTTLWLNRRRIQGKSCICVDSLLTRYDNAQIEGLYQEIMAIVNAKGCLAQGEREILWGKPDLISLSDLMEGCAILMVCPTYNEESVIKEGSPLPLSYALVGNGGRMGSIARPLHSKSDLSIIHRGDWSSYNNLFGRLPEAV